jgi:acyl carrier protein
MRLLVMFTLLRWLGYLAALIGVLVVVGIPLWIWQSRAKKKRIENAFQGRQPLDERMFYERYFESRGVPFFVVHKVRLILEEELAADLSRLSAKDDFAQNLSFFWDYESSASVEIVVRLEDEFKIKITDAEAERTTTSDDIVNLGWLKVRERAA